jgi:hypothetical protein
MIQKFTANQLFQYLKEDANKKFVKGHGQYLIEMLQGQHTSIARLPRR